MTVDHSLAMAARGVTKTYHVGAGLGRSRRLAALRGIDLNLQRGEILGVVGESGCGKSTLARLLLGVESPNEGEIRIAGRLVDSYGRLERARLVQPVFQDPYSSLNPRMSIGRIIAAPLVVQGRDGSAAIREKVRALMLTVGLSEHLLTAYPDQLSGGQRQRVAIARALISEPEVLILDEPTSALDVSVQSQILNLIARLHREMSLSIILISHNLAIVEHLADRVAVMYLGEVVEQATAQEIFHRARHPYTQSLLDAILVPVGSKHLPRPSLSGEVPNPIFPPSGCTFHPRCVRCNQICRTTRPGITETHSASWRCHHPLG